MNIQKKVFFLCIHWGVLVALMDSRESILKVEREQRDRGVILLLCGHMRGGG